MRPVCLLGSAQNLLQAKRLRFAIASPGKIYSVSFYSASGIDDLSENGFCHFFLDFLKCFFCVVFSEHESNIPSKLDNAEFSQMTDLKFSSLCLETVHLCA